MRKYSVPEIKKRIEVFLVPEKVKVHGRRIYASEASRCGLKVRSENVRGKLWSLMSDLNFRLNDYVSQGSIAKCVESLEHSFYAKSPPIGEKE